MAEVPMQSRIGTYEVWVPEIGKKVRSSSLVVNEEHFPWLGAKAHQPLVSFTSTMRYMSDHLGSDVTIGADSNSTEAAKSDEINATPRPSLSFLILFSGPYDRKDGLSKVMSTFGWDRITNFDNDENTGGGWEDDLLNDSRYVEFFFFFSGFYNKPPLELTTALWRRFAV